MQADSSSEHSRPTATSTSDDVVFVKEGFNVATILKPTKPKRLLTTYMCFVKTRYAAMSDEQKSQGIKANAAKLKEEWKVMSEEEKKTLEASIKQDEDRYKK